MPWELWIVPIIALAVWIISQLRGGDEPPQNRQRPLGDPGRQPANDVERFLEEINRLRQRSAQQQRPESRPEPPPPEPVAEVLPADPVEPTAPPMFERPSPPPVRPQPRPDPAKVKERIARARRKETAKRPQPIQDVIPVAIPVAAPLAVAALPPSRVSPAVAQLHALLQAPATLQTAVLLQEVLGPPRCRRVGPGGGGNPRQAAG